DVRGEAIYLGSQDETAYASASIYVHADAGNVRIQGARALADGDVLGTGTGDASANAVIDLDASGNINVGTGGCFADADALAANASHAIASAVIEADAGSGGIGGVFIQGNVISVATAIGGAATPNTAYANVHLAAGGGTEFGNGTGTFGNVAVIGNIGAFAYADVASDKATASVEIFARNNIFIIGNDPIASAHAGPGGSVFAFRQAHFTTNSTAFGPGGRSIADIDIRAGDQVIVDPASSLVHIEALFALPTHTPTLEPNGLTIIPLSVDGKGCGVLGQAGADAKAINKGEECHKSPINVSDLTDVTP